MFSPVNVSVWFVCRCKASFQSIDKFIEHRLLENETIGSQQNTICIVFEEGTVDEECLDDFVRMGPNLKSFADGDPLDPLQLSGSPCNSSEPKFVNYKRTERIKTEWGTENSTVSSNGGAAITHTDCNFEWDFGSSDSVAMMTETNNTNLNLDAVALNENIIPTENINNYSNELIPAEDEDGQEEQGQFIILLGNENDNDDEEQEGIINSDNKSVVDHNLFELESVHSENSYELSLSQNGVSLTEIDIEEVSEDALSFCGSEYSSTRSSSPDSDSGPKKSVLNYENVDFGKYSPPLLPEERFESFETVLTNFQESQQKMENISYQFNSYADNEPAPAERPPYQCSIPNCHSSFKNQRTLQLHLKSHAEVLPYMCPEDGCGKLFSTDFQLTFHMKHHYTGHENQDNVVVGNTKLDPFKEKHVISKHVKPKSTTTFQQIHSQQQTPRFENKKLGLVEKLPIKSITSRFNNYKNKSEANPGTSLIHYKTATSTGGVRETKKDEPSKLLSTNSRGKNKSTSSNSSAPKPQPEHGRPTLPKPKSKDSINNPNPFHLQCRYCKKFQRSLTVLNMHERIHTGEKEFHCQHCTRGFTWKQAWKVHEGKCKEAKGGSSMSKIKNKQSHSHEGKTLIMSNNTNFFGDHREETKLKVRTTKDKDREMFFPTTKKGPTNKNKTTMKLVNSKNIMDLAEQPESRDKMRVPKKNRRRLSPHSQLQFAASVLTTISEANPTFISKTTGQVSFQQGQPNKPKLGPQLLVNKKVQISKKSEKKQMETTKIKIGNKAETPVKDTETFSLECRFCKKISRCKPELILHERIHTGEKPFICGHCSRSFTWKQSRDVHMKICKKKASKIQKNGVTSGEIPVPAKSTTQFINIETKDRETLSFKAKNADFPQQQQKRDVQFPISKPESQHKLKKLIMEEMNSVAVKEASKTKSNKRQETYQTEKMDNVNYGILSLKTKNEDKVRKGEMEDNAVASTSTSTSIASNNSSTTRDKLHICSYCSKAFTHKGNMTTHERVHTGEEPFSCRCEKRFKSAAGLAYHLNRPTSFQCAKAFY